MITELEFKSLAAQGYNRIPLMAEAFADLETPLSLYLKLAYASGGGKHSILLESVVGGERFGRYSFIGLPARTLLRATGFRTEVVTNGQVVELNEGNPLDFIAAYQKRFKVALRPGMPRFCGGLAGYFGYDAVRFIEPKLAKTSKPGGIDTPDILLLQCEELAVIDNLSGRLYLIVYADPAQPESFHNAKRRLAELGDKLKYSVTAPAVKRGAAHDVEREFGKEAYVAAVLRAKEYIAAGDAFQIVPSQRFSVPFALPPFALYRALRRINPAPFLFFLNFENFAIVGSSPEILVRLRDDIVTIRPLAGTRRRGETVEEDRALEADLLADPKERAEHLMLLDLGRNDVGRVAEIGTVKVTESFAIERFSHVMHISSTVQGTIRKGLDALDALVAGFPAGTLTGAPKVRAMEIIEELEPTRRAFYAGCIGYFAANGTMDTCIGLRTALVKDGTMHVQAGGGVVADSDPVAEYEETRQKARALFRAAEEAVRFAASHGGRGENRR